MRKLFPMETVSNAIGTGDSSMSSSLDSIIGTINNVITTAVGIVTAGVVILAIFIAFKFFTAETEDKRKNAKAQLIYAIIGIVVLIALLIFVPTITGAIKGALGNTNTSTGS